MTVVDRFWAKVDQRGECWTWTAARSGSAGYGVFYPTRTHRWYAHRFAWLLTHGDPGESLVLHQCDNPACVRPDHLFLGTTADNIADKVAKGRQQRGERAGGARLSNWDVVVMRELASAGALGSELARAFGVSKASVSRILNGKRYTEARATA